MGYDLISQMAASAHHHLQTLLILADCIMLVALTRHDAPPHTLLNAFDQPPIVPLTDPINHQSLHHPKEDVRRFQADLFRQ